MLASQAVAGIPGRGDVDLRTLGVEGAARQRHVVFPADQHADPPRRRLDHPQAAGVSEAPDHALGVRRHQLAVTVGDAAVGVDDHGAVEERAACGAVDLVQPSDDDDAAVAGDVAERAQAIPAEVDGVRGEGAVQVVRRGHVLAGAQPPDPRRVARQPGLGEDHEPGTRVGGLGDEIDRPREARLEVQEDRRVLDDGGAQQRLPLRPGPRRWRRSRPGSRPRRAASRCGPCRTGSSGSSSRASRRRSRRSPGRGARSSR